MINEQKSGVLQDDADPVNEGPDAENLPLPEVGSHTLSKSKRFGREIAYGIQQTLVCFATDFIDPIISKWYQNKYGNKEHEVTNKHTMGGEVIGDFAALGVYLGAKRMFQKPLDALIAGVKRGMNPLLTKLGKTSIKDWQYREDVDEDSRRYKIKLEEYKQFQAENIVDTGIIAVSSTAINVGAQRWLGNKQDFKLIFYSKVIGAALTMAGMLGLRGVLPDTTKKLDDELSERYFSKVIRRVQKAAGAEEEVDPDHELHVMQHKLQKEHELAERAAGIPVKKFATGFERNGFSHVSNVQSSDTNPTLGKI